MRGIYKSLECRRSGQSGFTLVELLVVEIQRKDNPDRIAAASSTQDQIQWNPAGNGHRRSWKKTLSKCSIEQHYGAPGA